MAFSQILPIARVKAGTFKVSTSKPRGNGADWSLTVTVPSAEFTRRFGAAERFNVLLGSGADEGKLAIEPAEGGAFKAAGLKNCFVLRLPPAELWPKDAFVAEEPERVMRDGMLVIDLPEWAWSKERQKAILLARQQVARERGVKG